MSLTGSSQEIPLVDVVQVGANNRQTCRITVRAERGQGELFLARGELVHATCGALRGEEAAYRLLGASRASYRIEAGGVSDERTIHRGCQHVVLEAARRADEDARIVTCATTAPLPTLEREQPARAARWWRWAALAALALALIGAGGALAWWQAPRRPVIAPAPVAAAEPAPRPAIEASELRGPEDAAPIALDTPSPIAPAASALTPTIACRILVDEHGAVRDAKIYRSRLDLTTWEDAALDAVSAWRFTPARHEGAPIAAWLNVAVGFTARAAASIRLTVKGSDTIGGEHGVGQDLARAFAAAHPGVEVVWEGLGSVATAARPAAARIAGSTSWWRRSDLLRM